MIKKIFCLFPVIILSLFITSCNPSYEADARFIVSAIAADNDNGNIMLTVQVIAIGEGDFENEPKVLLIRSSAKNAETAVKKIGTKCIKPLNFDHCAVLICSKDLKPEQFKDVRDFCLERKDINLAVHVCFAENAKKILSAEKIAGITSGYDLAVMINSKIRENKDDFKCKFYEIADKSDITLPYIALSDKRIFLKGHYGLILSSEEDFYEK